MVTIAVLLLTTYMAIKDLCTHTISDRSNGLLLFLLLLDVHLIDFLHIIVAWLLLLFLSLATHLGGGDFKLLTVLLISQGKIMLTSNYGLGFSIVATFTLVVILWNRRSLRGSIPMGPAILAPFAIGYLAI